MSSRYLFIDPTLIEQSTDIHVRVNPPVRQTVLNDHRHWDRQIGLYSTVIDAGDRLRLWYGYRADMEQMGMAYLESTDGVHWERPNLGLVECHGSRENNLVNLPTMEGSVYLDPTMDDERCYGFVGSLPGVGICRWTSPDGLYWIRDAEPLLLFDSDTQNVVYWDEELRQYRCYVRAWLLGSSVARRRKVGYFTVPSLNAPLPLTPTGPEAMPPARTRYPHFTEEVPIVLACDKQDPPDTDVYTMAPLRYPVDPRYHLAFPTMYAHLIEDERGPYRNEGRCESHFAGSLDGVAWHRYDRTPYAAPGLAGSESANMVFLGLGMVVRGDEIWQYGIGFRTLHGLPELPLRIRDGDGALLRFVQRLDGFVSADAGPLGGAFRTRPLACDGQTLLLNADSGALGQVQIGVRTADGNPLPGYAVEDCAPLRGNATGLRVTWHGKPLPAALVGQTVQLDVRMRGARVYSLRFEE